MEVEENNFTPRQLLETEIRRIWNTDDDFDGDGNSDVVERFFLGWSDDTPKEGVMNSIRECVDSIVDYFAFWD